MPKIFAVMALFWIVALISVAIGREQSTLLVGFAYAISALFFVFMALGSAQASRRESE